MQVSKITLVALVVGLGCSEPSGVTPSDPFAGTRWVDLTHAYDSETVFGPTGQPFVHERTSWGETVGGYFYASYDLSVSEHAGTHVDAPIHFSAGGATIDDVPLDDLIGPAAIIDVTERSEDNADYLATVDDLNFHEATHGTIPSDAIVVIRTGWSKRWPDVKAYMGDDRPGRTDDLHFPGISPELAEALVSRGVTAVGIDTASIDYGRSTNFRSHQIFGAAAITGLENLTGLDALPEHGAWIMALPMKIGEGSGGPARIVALVKE